MFTPLLGRCEGGIDCAEAAIPDEADWALAESAPEEDEIEAARTSSEILPEASAAARALDTSSLWAISLRTLLAAGDDCGAVGPCPEVLEEGFTPAACTWLRGASPSER